MVGNTIPDFGELENRIGFGFQMERCGKEEENLSLGEGVIALLRVYAGRAFMGAGKVELY